MSLLDKLFGFLDDDSESTSYTEVEHPCANCPSSCTIAPAACSVCQPYKEQMIDAIYRVEHKDEILSQYEVVGVSVQEGSVVCPHCGGHSDNPYICDFCGSKLQEGSGKIKVASASEIPNPILEAQDIIFARYEAVKGYAGADSGYGYEDALSGVGSQGLLTSIFSAFMGESTSSDTQSIGKKMTEDEIGEMAKYYGVSVSDYLTGLDNGKYLTLSNKTTAAKAEETYTRNYQSTSSTGGMSDLAGLAGALGLGSMLFGGTTYNRSAARNPYQNRSSRPAQNPRPAGTMHTVDPRVVNQQKADPRLKEATAQRAPSPAGQRSVSSGTARLEQGKLQSAGRQTAPTPARPVNQKSAQPVSANKKAAPAAANRAPAPNRAAAPSGNEKLNSGTGNARAAAGRVPDSLKKAQNKGGNDRLGPAGRRP